MLMTWKFFIWSESDDLRLNINELGGLLGEKFERQQM